MKKIHKCCTSTLCCNNNCIVLGWKHTSDRKQDASTSTYIHYHFTKTKQLCTYGSNNEMLNMWKKKGRNQNPKKLGQVYHSEGTAHNIRNGSNSSCPCPMVGDQSFSVRFLVTNCAVTGWVTSAPQCRWSYFKLQWHVITLALTGAVTDLVSSSSPLSLLITDAWAGVGHHPRGVWLIMLMALSSLRLSWTSVSACLFFLSFTSLALRWACVHNFIFLSPSQQQDNTSQDKWISWEEDGKVTMPGWIGSFWERFCRTWKDQ